jgi:hypothetical protein
VELLHPSDVDRFGLVLDGTVVVQLVDAVSDLILHTVVVGQQLELLAPGELVYPTCAFVHVQQ